MGRLILWICMTSLIMGWAGLTWANGFHSNCPRPFSGTPAPDPISDCGNEGSAKLSEPSLSPAHRAQNVAKINLCAPAPEHRITFAALDRLQSEMDDLVTAGQLRYGEREVLPEDRTVLHGDTSVGELHEGDLVELVGFVNVVRPGSGESCNCNKTRRVQTDIHIQLTQHANDDLCQSVTAEMIPHFRPREWTFVNVRQLEGSRVRVVGQLFFDGSHRPCQHPQHSDHDPERATEWEIHPE